MKKLLLPLLAASTLLLMGCNRVAETKKDFGWKTLKPDEYIIIYFSNTSQRYDASADIEVKYDFIAYESVAELFLETTYTNGSHQNAYFVGADLTIYHYEV